VGFILLIACRWGHIAVRVGGKLGVSTVAMLDTVSDLDGIDLPIPGNDDAMRAIEIIVRELADAVIEAKAARPEKAEDAQQPRRRSSRAAFRADEGGAGKGEEAPPPQESTPSEPVP